MEISNKLTVTCRCNKCGATTKSEARITDMEHRLTCTKCGNRIPVSLDRRCSIESFREDYGFLSNFFPCHIEFDGLYFGSVEAAFQAQKCINADEKMKFQFYDAKTAKKKGRQVELRRDWNRIKDSVLRNLLYIKFITNPVLGKMLLGTGEALITETNTWHDNYYGDCKCPKCYGKSGRNLLGALLMEVRKALATGIEINTVSIVTCFTEDGEENLGTITLKGVGLTPGRAEKIIQDSYNRTTACTCGRKETVEQLGQRVGYDILSCELSPAVMVFSSHGK